MNAYGQYCPVARALEVVGDRWSLLIVRDMLAGRTHFNAIERALPGISRAVLAQRLRQLEAGGVVRRHADSRGRASAYALPPRRVVVEFRFRGGRRPYIWLVLDRCDEADVCLKHPGFEPDLVVSADAEVFFHACFGRVSWSEAKQRGWIRCDGNPTLWRAFPSWFDWPSLPSRARAAEGASASASCAR